MDVLGIDLLLLSAYLEVMVQLRHHTRDATLVLIHSWAEGKELIITITCQHWRVWTPSGG